jgi:hypothetical protein
MKANRLSLIAAAAVLGMALVGCASTASYTHSEETHKEAVNDRLQRIHFASVRRPVLVKFSVEEAGSIGFVGASGGHRYDRAGAVKRIEQAAPFPPHENPEGLNYSVWFVPDSMDPRKVSASPE